MRSRFAIGLRPDWNRPPRDTAPIFLPTWCRGSALGPVPLIVETHSEMILLRARHWVAEGRLPAGHVLVYRVHAQPGSGSMLEKIGIRENGEMETWPDGVFMESYEEILAIRRAGQRPPVGHRLGVLDHAAADFGYTDLPGVPRRVRRKIRVLLDVDVTRRPVAAHRQRPNRPADVRQVLAPHLCDQCDARHEHHAEVARLRQADFSTSCRFRISFKPDAGRPSPLQ